MTRAAARLATLRAAATPGPAAAWGALLLAALYTLGYLAHPFLPGNMPAQPLGWWGWWDQSHYLASARALAQGDLAPARHWYPLGYALLAAPFVPVLRAHPFFVVDLAALLGCFAGYLAVARRYGLAAGWAAAGFVLAVAADPLLFRTWIEPWNTSPVAALLWLMLAAIAARLAGAPGRGRIALVGAMAAGVAAIRPADTVAAGTLVLGLLAFELPAGRLGWRELAALALGGGAVALPVAALHLAIHGLARPDYMQHSAALGFAFGALGFKAFVLLEEPRVWFGTGTGLLQRAPWLALGAAGVVPALWAARPPARWLLGLLAAAMALHLAVYVAYVDLLPTGLWRYQNVHYLKWLLPGFALFAMLWLREAVRGARRAALAGLAAVLALLTLRLVPVPAGQGPARLLLFPAPPDPSAYFAAAALRDARGEVANIAGMRLVPSAEGLRVVALRRDFVGPVSWVVAPAGVEPGAAPRRYAVGIGFGWPCALPPWPCRASSLP